MSEKKTKMRFKWSWVIALFFSAVIVLILAAYIFSGTVFGKVLAKGFSLPAALVGSHEVSLSDYVTRSEILNKVPGNIRDENLSSGNQKNALLDKMVENKVAELIAK